MKTSLQDLLREGSVRRVRSNKRVIDNALAKAHKDLIVAEKLIELKEYDWAYASSYTSMYSAARALMNHMGFRPSSRDSHVSLIKFLALVEVGKEVNEFSIILDRLRRNRHRVMYDDYDFITENVALDAKSWSVKFLSIIEEKLKTST